MCSSDLPTDFKDGDPPKRQLGTCGPPSRRNPERQAAAEGMTPDKVVRRLLEEVRPPRSEDYR